MALRADQVPKAAEIVWSLCIGESGIGLRGKSLHFKNSEFYSIISHSMAHCDFIYDDGGAVGETVLGPIFDDEKGNLLHDRAGILSMLRVPQNPCMFKFMLTGCSAPSWLGEPSLACGIVIGGDEVLQKIFDVGALDGKPKATVRISDCGELTGHQAEPKESEVVPDCLHWVTTDNKRAPSITSPLNMDFPNAPDIAVRGRLEQLDRMGDLEEYHFCIGWSDREHFLHTPNPASNAEQLQDLVEGLTERCNILQNISIQHETQITQLREAVSCWKRWQDKNWGQGI
jgi:peptidylprolyl isomerase